MAEWLHETTTSDAAPLRPVPDLGGAPTEDASGIPAGTLVGALAEVDTGLIRYLDLALHGTRRHVLVPIGHARLQEEDGQPSVRLRAALLEELEQIPPYEADTTRIDDPFERELLQSHGRSFAGERYYAHPAFDHSGLYAGEHPIVSDAPGDEHILTRLAYVPGFHMAEGEPDIRSWPLRLDDHEAVILDLIVDGTARRVRYAFVDVDGDRQVLVPVGFLAVDEPARIVRAPGLRRADLLALPRVGSGGITRDQEETVHRVLRERLDGPRRYALPDFRPDTGLAAG